MNEFISHSIIFIFIFAWLFLIKNILSIAKVMVTESGKYEADNITLGLIGASISYIITTLIYWL